MNNKYIFTFILLVLLSLPVQAITWDEVLQKTDKNNHEIISAKEQVDSAEWSHKKSFSTFLPQVSANASLGQTYAATQAAGATSYSYGLSASQYLFKGMNGIYDIQSAYAGLKYEKANYDKTKASIYYDARAAFIAVLIEQENIKLLQKIEAMRKNNVRLIQLRYDSGREDKGNLMTTKAEEMQSKYDLNSANRDLNLSKLNLSQLIQTEILTIEGALELNKPDALKIDNLLRINPDYLLAKYTLEKAQIQNRASISGYLPTVSLSGNYSKRGAEWPPETRSKSWSLNVSYDIFSGGSNMADVKINELNLKSAEENYEQSLKDIKYNIEKAHSDYVDTLEMYDVAKYSLSAANERAEIAKAKYLNGLIQYDEWNRIENSYIQAEKSLLNYRKSTLLAEANWHKSYGGWIK